MELFWKESPFIRLLLPFTGGILIYLHFKPEYNVSGYLLVIALVLLIITSRSGTLSFRKQWIYGILLSISLIITGYQLTRSKTASNLQDHFMYKKPANYLLARIMEPVTETAKMYKAHVQIEALLDSSEMINCTGEALWYFSKDSSGASLRYGDLILTNQSLIEISEPANPGEFHYKKYLGHKGIYHQSFVRDHWKKIETAVGFDFMQRIYEIRMHFLTSLKTYIPDHHQLGVASALVLGYKGFLDNQISKIYSNTGAIHVLAVSGLHVGIIFLLLNNLLAFLERVPKTKYLKTGIMLVSIWLFAILTGSSPSVLRAATMFSFIIIGQLLNRHTNIYNTLAASAFFILCYDPYLIVNLGFQLSYIAVFGIVLLQDRFYHLIHFNNLVMDKIWAISTVSIAAQIATFPLTILYFHQFPNYFLLSNLIVIPAAAIILYMGILLLAVAPFTQIAAFVGYVLNKVILFTNTSLGFIEGLPFSLTRGISITSLECLGIYAAMIFAGSFLLNHSLHYLKIAIAITIILLLHNIYDGYRFATQRSLTIYAISKSTAIDFMDGNVAYFLADSIMMENNRKSEYHLSNNRILRGIDAVYPFIIENRLIRSNDTTRGFFLHHRFVQFYDKRILILTDLPKYTPPTVPLKVDYLVICQNPRLKIRELIYLFDFEIIIFDSSNSFWNVDRWIEECKANNIKYHSTGRSGAFIVNMD